MRSYVLAQMRIGAADNKRYNEIILDGKNHLALMPENITKYEQNITRGHYFRGVE